MLDARRGPGTLDVVQGSKAPHPATKPRTMPAHDHSMCAQFRFFSLHLQVLIKVLRDVAFAVTSQFKLPTHAHRNIPCRVPRIASNNEAEKQGLQHRALLHGPLCPFPPQQLAHREACLHQAAFLDDLQEGFDAAGRALYAAGFSYHDAPGLVRSFVCDQVRACFGCSGRL